MPLEGVNSSGIDKYLTLISKRSYFLTVINVLREENREVSVSAIQKSNKKCYEGAIYFLFIVN